MTLSSRESLISLYGIQLQTTPRILHLVLAVISHETDKLQGKQFETLVVFLLKKNTLLAYMVPKYMESSHVDLFHTVLLEQ